MIAPTIHTPRLNLIRLTNTAYNSQHHHWFHADWSDPDATSWSIRGMSTSLEESHKRMVDAIDKDDTYDYCVFDSSTSDGTRENPGTHLGSVALRTQSSGPTTPALMKEGADTAKELDLRVLGYAYFKHAWGHGYATEAARALLDAYAVSVANEKARGEKVFYVEAGVDEGNLASMAILKKLGFERVGFKSWEEKVFLGGAWRENGVWVWGMYV
jgi:RimJ/RimL family protein N-acetyltransferase